MLNRTSLAHPQGLLPVACHESRIEAIVVALEHPFDDAVARLSS
jgi:hypothetical protein